MSGYIFSKLIGCHCDLINDKICESKCFKCKFCLGYANVKTEREYDCNRLFPEFEERLYIKKFGSFNPNDKSMFIFCTHHGD